MRSRGHIKANDVDESRFRIRQVELSWQGIAENLDCGVFLLYHCCAYYGKDFEAPALHMVLFFLFFFFQFCHLFLCNVIVDFLI